MPVAESTIYQNLVIPPVWDPKSKTTTKPPAPRAKPNYPHTIKVHIYDKTDCLAFAKLIKTSLSTSQKKITYTGPSTQKAPYTFTDERKHKPRKPDYLKKRLETRLWHAYGMPEYDQKDVIPYMTYNVTFPNEAAFMNFTRVVKQRLSLQSTYMTYPATQLESVLGFAWVSKFKDTTPKYPIYIISKGRAATRLTSRSLERMKVPYFIVVEPQDYEDYRVFIDESKILVAPFSNHGDGPGRARNWCWDHSVQVMKSERHWVLDDNIEYFFRLHKNRKIKFADGGVFRVAEDFVDQFENVKIAGFNYHFFTPEKTGVPPFRLNNRIYSVLLIDNNCRHRWRGRYNEDTILSLDVLKDGDCTIQFNSFLQGKAPTQKLTGGNTEEFYDKEGTWNKSKMLEETHPDVAKVVYKFGRWHHHVNYQPFELNLPRIKAGMVQNLGVEYRFELIKWRE